MCHLNQALILILLCGILCGCSADNATVPPETTAPNAQTIAFSFPVPQGYGLEPDSYQAVTLTRGGEAVGGIRRADVHQQCLLENECNHLHDYLELFAPGPLMAQYISQYDEGKAYISVDILDVEAGDKVLQSQSHTLFPQDDGYYDFWVDSALVGREEQDSIFAVLSGKGTATPETTLPGEQTLALTPPQPTAATMPPTLPATPPEERRLTLTVTQDDQAPSVQKKLQGWDFTYWQVTDLAIRLGEETLPLETALEQGRITLEELDAFAKIDAAQGRCQMRHDTHLGLTQFLYRYPEYDLRITQDVYETPDGKQHLMRIFGVYAPGMDISTTYQDDETGLPLDLEDWGLDFAVSDPTATGLTLTVQQSGGQQMGNLMVESYMLFDTDYKPVAILDDSCYLLDPPLPIQSQGQSTLTLDWSGLHGPVAPGAYRLKVRIQDQYDPASVPPLTRNYHDSQSYWLDVTIPR